MSDSAIITFNADREKLANDLGKTLKASNKAISGITSDFSTTYIIPKACSLAVSLLTVSRSE